MTTIEEDREKTRALHTKIRTAAADVGHRGNAAAWKDPSGWGNMRHRDLLLLWGYVRGFKFRRIERSHYVQETAPGVFYVHNLPSEVWLSRIWSTFLDETAAELAPKIKAWLADPSGAIAAPAPRAKRPYIAAIAAE